MFIGLPIKFRRRLPHPIELCLTVPLKYVGIALPQHQRDEVVRNPVGAQSAREGVPAGMARDRKVGNLGAASQFLDRRLYGAQRHGASAALAQE